MVAWKQKRALKYYTEQTKGKNLKKKERIMKLV